MASSVSKSWQIANKHECMNVLVEEQGVSTVEYQIISFGSTLSTYL